MKTLKRIKWVNVAILGTLVAIMTVYSLGFMVIGERRGIDKLRYSQQQEERLNLEVKHLDEENDRLRSDNFKLRLDLSNAQDDIEELKAQLDNN